MAQQGWIKLHRKLRDSAIWGTEPFSKGQAWVDLLLAANHADSTMFVRGIAVPLKRGVVGESETTLADRWKWSRGKVRRFLSWLETVQQIVQQKNNVMSLVVITNYDAYQGNGTANGTTDGPQTVQQTIQQTVQQTDTNKNEKNVKNEKNEKKKGASVGRKPVFKIPTAEEVAAYCQKRSNGIDAQAFFDYHEQQEWKLSNGNPMKNWKAAVRTWENRRKEQSEKDSEPEDGQPLWNLL